MIDVSAKLNAAQQLAASGRLDQARALLMRALQQHPGHPDLSNGMALILMAQGQPEQALYHAQRAAAARPDDPILLTNIGSCLGMLRRNDEAEAPLRRAISLAPALASARQGLANILRVRGEYTAAAEQLEAALKARPDDPGLASLYAAVLTNLARVADSVAFARSFLSRRPDVMLASMWANAMTYHAGAEPAEVFQAHVAYGKLLERATPAPAPHGNDRAPERALNIGVLSHELRRHAVATFLEPWLTGRDRSGFRITCYATSPVEDEVTTRLRAAADRWRSVVDQPDAAIAAQIRRDGVDILLDTTGLTQGHRMGVLAMKPAPVQAMFIGYLNTTGVRTVDWRIVDGFTDPAGAEATSVERLWRLEPTYLCYSPAPDAPEPGPPPSLTAGRITFGSFNSAAKINGPLIELWARVLAAAPESRLVLKAFDFTDARLREDLAARFASAGVDPVRVLIEPPTLGAFLAQYHRIDIALDTLPFNGTTTTMDALWMGVPVVTLAGRMHAGRTGVSILSTLGLSELITNSPEEYVEAAASLARNPARLTELRSSLRGRIESSPLRDGPGYARKIDTALRGMWRAWAAG
jgi:predicted O-linked N-acetylglucosamine transferase (SPINDLY family)